MQATPFRRACSLAVSFAVLLVGASFYAHHVRAESLAGSSPTPPSFVTR